MTKSNLLKIVNPVLILLFLSQALTGIFHDVIQEISYESFKVIHGFGGYLFAAAALFHFYLNWQWIKSNFLKRR
jgi:hypothetical protein